jgi:hypothetical protein
MFQLFSISPFGLLSFSCHIVFHFPIWFCLVIYHFSSLPYITCSSFWTLIILLFCYSFSIMYIICMKIQNLIQHTRLLEILGNSSHVIFFHHTTYFNVHHLAYSNVIDCSSIYSCVQFCSRKVIQWFIILVDDLVMVLSFVSFSFFFVVYFVQCCHHLYLSTQT